MADLRDPLADLKAEIEAEEAAAAGAQPANSRQTAPADDPELEPDDDANPEPAAAAAEADPDADPADGEAEPKDAKAEEPAKKPRKARDGKEPRMVPVDRLNEYAVKNRKLEKSVEELAKQLEALRNPPKPEDKPTPRQLSEQEIRQQERAAARLEIQLESFTSSGNAGYGREAFDAACDKIQNLIGGPSNLISVAIEATGSEKDAAKAIYLLGQEDAPEIEAFLRLSDIRKATYLARLASARARGKEESAPTVRRRAEPEEETPAPIRPVRGASRVEEGLGDDVPEDVWFKRFDDKILKQPRSH